LRLTFVFALAALAVVAAPALGSGYTLMTFSQTYQIAAQGAITVICPDVETAPDAWLNECVAMHDMPGAPPEKQMWIGGVGIDLPLDAIAQTVIVQDATGTATPAGVCVDHNMNNLCGPSDAEQEPGMPEHAVFFCGEYDDMATTFPPMPPMADMMMAYQHVDVWVRTFGGVGWPTDQLGATEYGAPFCGLDALGLPNSGPVGVGTRGVVTITALVPN
jgi:hypothetical protein